MGWLNPYVPMPSWNDPGYNTPENYQIRIYSSEYSDVLVANLPENFQLSLGSDWDQPFAKPLSEYMQGANILSARSGNIAGLVSSVTGMSSQMKWLSMSVWTQGTGLELTLPLVFRAFKDPVKDVTDKIVRLMRMVSPSTHKGGSLQAPGPSIAGNAGGPSAAISGEKITVELGNFVRLSPVIVRQVSSEVVSQFDRDGNPMSATVSVSIQTPYVITKEDLAELFVNNSLKRNNSGGWEQDGGWSGEYEAKG